MTDWNWEDEPYCTHYRQIYKGCQLLIHQYNGTHLYGVICIAPEKTNVYFGGPSRKDDCFPQRKSEAVLFLENVVNTRNLAGRYIGD